MLDERGRSREARRLAERALVLILWELRDTAIRPIVLGGLVPEVLTVGQEFRPPPHIGTTDVDLLITFELDDLAGLRELELALERAGFGPDEKGQGGWRWRGAIEDLSVRVELLCDRDDLPNEQVVPLSDRLGALNLRGTGYVARDYVESKVRGALRNGTEVEVLVRFAGLEGYLLAKLGALRRRDLGRDHYDFVYVLLYNRLGGPREAAAALRAGEFAADLPRLAGDLAELRARFGDPRQHGPQSFAAESLGVVPGEDAARLAQEAVGAVAVFLEELERQP